jgi:hypothetical protein
MNDPEILDRILESCTFRFRNALCPNKRQSGEHCRGETASGRRGVVGRRMFLASERGSEMRDDLLVAQF